MKIPGKLTLHSVTCLGLFSVALEFYHFNIANNKGTIFSWRKVLCPLGVRYKTWKLGSETLLLIFSIYCGRKNYVDLKSFLKNVFLRFSLKISLQNCGKIFQSMIILLAWKKTILKRRTVPDNFLI